MKRKKILELGKKGTDFDIVIPANTNVMDITEGIALFIIETAKVRGIKPTTALAEIQQWVTHLEEHL